MHISNTYHHFFPYNMIFFIIRSYVHNLSNYRKYIESVTSYAKVRKDGHVNHLDYKYLDLSLL